MKIYIEHNEALYPVNLDDIAVAMDPESFAYLDEDNIRFGIEGHDQIFIEKSEIYIDKEQFRLDLFDTLSVIATREAAKRSK